MRVIRLATALLAATAGLLLVACGHTTDSSDLAPTTSGLIAATGSTTPMQGTAPAQARNQEDDMRIEITVSGHEFHATLDDSAASQDLVAQLPLTLEMGDHGGVEKTGPLPAPLSLDGQPAGADPDVGDVGYYAPGNDFVLYYGDQSFYDGIVVLGHLEGDAAERIAGLPGRITATVVALEG